MTETVEELIIKKSFLLDIYRTRLDVIICKDFNKGCIKHIKGFDIEATEHIDGMFIERKDKPFHCYIVLSPTSLLSSVSHEAFHAVCHIMRSIGGELVHESEESYAYLLSLIIEKVYSTLEAYDKQYSKLETNKEIDNK